MVERECERECERSTYAERSIKYDEFGAGRDDVVALMRPHELVVDHRVVDLCGTGS